MTALFYLLGVVAFVLAILASIGLHELGHMIPAKAFGGKVTQYFIGFGPTVWSRLRQDRRDAPTGQGPCREGRVRR
jgi:membrane-associated protease RseP (regulator of RpoE activity)